MLPKVLNLQASTIHIEKERRDVEFCDEVAVMPIVDVEVAVIP
jgi:hypothetical protein